MGAPHTPEELQEAWRRHVLEMWDVATQGEFEEEAKVLAFANILQDAMARMAYAHAMHIVGLFANHHHGLIAAIRREIEVRANLVTRGRKAAGENGEAGQ